MFALKVSTWPKKEKFPLSGLLQNPFSTDCGPAPVMCGAMDAFCLKYGLWDANHFILLAMLRYAIFTPFMFAWICSSQIVKKSLGSCFDYFIARYCRNYHEGSVSLHPLDAQGLFISS